MGDDVARRLLALSVAATVLAGSLFGAGAGVRRLAVRDLKTDFGKDGEAAFGRPVALAHDAESVYVVDAEAHEIRVFTKAGRFLRVLGRRGQGPGEFNVPADVDVHNGRLYVADKLNGRIQVLERDGRPAGGFRVPFGPDQIAVLDGERIAVTHLPAPMAGAEPMLQCLSMSGTLLWESVLSKTSEDPTYDVFRNLAVMARDGGDVLCVIRKSGEDAVRRFDVLGRPLAPMPVPRSYPVRRVTLPLRGPRKVLEAFCWDAAVDAGRVALLAPGDAGRGDVGPGDMIFLLGPETGVFARVELPHLVRRIDLDEDRIYAVDENNDLRVFKMEPR